MLSSIIGISSAAFLIVLLMMLKGSDRQVVYGLVLTGIGFLYIGFTWTDLTSLLITATQAFVFLVIAWYGIKKSMYVLAVGYFLHGSWDLAYEFLSMPDLIPPHYDLFCLSFDFTVGIYLLFLARKTLAATAIKGT